MTKETQHVHPIYPNPPTRCKALETGTMADVCSLLNVWTVPLTQRCLLNDE